MPTRSSASSTLRWSCGRGDAQEAHVAVAAHHHHVVDQDGEVPVDVLALRHVGDESCASAPRAAASPQMRISPCRGVDEAHDRLEQRRLAASR